MVGRETKSNRAFQGDARALSLSPAASYTADASSDVAENLRPLRPHPRRREWMLQVKIASTSELYPMMPPGPAGGEGRGLGPGGARDEAIVAASRERETRPPRDWGVQEVRAE